MDVGELVLSLLLCSCSDLLQLNPPSEPSGPRGWTEPKPKLWAKTKIGSCSIKIQEIPAYRPQFSGRKQEEYILPVHLFKKWKVKVKAKEYSSCFLPESCGRYAGISCILIEQEPILVIAQSFGFGFCSTPSRSLNFGKDKQILMTFNRITSLFCGYGHFKKIKFCSFQ